MIGILAQPGAREHVAQFLVVFVVASRHRIAKDAMPTNATECLKLTVSTTIYKKAAGQSSFAKVGSSVQKGIWNEGSPSSGFSTGGVCTLANKSGSVVVGTPNAAGQDIYRAAVHTSVAGAARGVRASIEFVVDAPA